MFFGLLIVLIPLSVGYLIPLRKPAHLIWVHRLLNWMIYAILFLMGMSFAFLENLSENVLLILKYSSVFITFIFIANFFALKLLERRNPWHSDFKATELPSRLKLAFESLQLCGVVVLGFLIGLTHLPILEHAAKGSELALITLLLLVGAQLRSSGMSLAQIALNRRGMMVSLVVVASSLIAGVLAALCLGLPIKAGMALSSGFGWYSLSAILITDAYGPVLGSTVFFNDLARELFSIMFVPVLMRYSRSGALGICGATSMDFTLPVLQRAGGMEMVPPAIVQGFVLSLFTPVLIALCIP